MREGAEEFVVNTLDRIPGIWERLRYIVRLRAPGRTHSHWGLEHTYGRETASEILADAHRSLFNGALTTPLSRLAQDGTVGALPEGASAYFRALHAVCPAFAPAEATQAAVLHFELVLDYLTVLAESDSAVSAA